MTFGDAKHKWESHDDWQFAERDAERKHFYRAGLLASVAIAKGACDTITMEDCIETLCDECFERSIRAAAEEVK